MTLSYDNGEGLVFTRTIAVDDHYLFTIKDEVQNKSGGPVTLFSLRAGFAPRHAEGARLLHPARGPDRRHGRPGPAGSHLQEDRRRQEEIETAGTSPTPGSALPTNIGRRRCCPTPTPRCTRASPSGEVGGQQDLSDRLSARRRRPSRPARPAPPMRGCSPAPRKSRWSASIFRFGPRRLQPSAPPQPFRSADRLGLVLFHHQADVSRHRLLLPSGRQFRHRHPDRHGAGQGCCSSRSPTNPTPRWRR